MQSCNDESVNLAIRIRPAQYRQDGEEQDVAQLVAPPLFMPEILDLEQKAVEHWCTPYGEFGPVAYHRMPRCSRPFRIEQPWGVLGLVHRAPGPAADLGQDLVLAQAVGRLSHLVSSGRLPW